jgi:molecular chaperone GrpE
MVKTDKKAAALSLKITDLENKLKRALADYDNLEKRIEREKRDFLLFSSAHLLRRVIAIIDDLDRCNVHLKDQGLTLVTKKFHDFLVEEGVTEIKAENQTFNPETMEAIEIVAGPKNQVVAVLECGYLYNEKVLRPTKVKVGSGVIAKPKIEVEVKVNQDVPHDNIN